MKKLIYCAAALATALFAGSCQQELLDTPAGENTVTYTVEVPGVATKAIADGKNVDRLYYEVYITDATTEADLSNAILLYKKDIAMVTSQEATSRANVTLNLVQNQNYTVLFWAQCDLENPVYDVTDLRNVTYKSGANVLSNHEDYAAFYSVDYISDSTPRDKKVYLQRPFAQLNIGTTINPVDYNKDYYKVAMKNSKVTVKNVPTQFNVATSAVAGDAEFTFAMEEVIKNENLVVNNTEYNYVAMNYMFAGANRTATVEYWVVAEVETQAGIPVETNLNKSIVNVPLKENYRTNIVGNLLTSSTEYEVIVDADWAGADLAPDPIYMAAALGGNVTLTDDVELASPLDIKADMTLNLNGKTITGSLNVAAGVAFVIENGKVVNTNKTVSGITSNGILTLNNVVIESARHALRIESGSAVINGGTYKVTPISNSTLYALNVGDGANSIANVTIKGGKFIGPKGTMADSGGAVTVKVGSTVKIEGGDFSGGKTETLSAKGTITITGGSYDQDPTTYVAEGYKTVQKNGKWYVASSETAKVVETTDDLEKDNNNYVTVFTENTTLFGDITLSADATTADSGYGATGVQVKNGAVLDGQGHTLTVNKAWTTWDCIVNTNGGTIKNLTVNGAMRGIFMGGATADVYIDNVIFKNVIYTFNSDGGTKDYGVYLSNCTINGWTSHSNVHKEVVYTNCSFGSGNGYKFCRPYGPTSFIGCDFCEGYEIEPVDGAIVTFQNCTLNGVELTDENMADLVIANLSKVVLVDGGNVGAFATNDTEVEAALDNESINTIYLQEGVFSIEAYTNFPAKESLTIVGTEGTKVKFKNQQVRMAQCKNFRIENCEILHMADKSWGMIVFGSGTSADGVYTISNCNFNGVGTQGIYINEDKSGAVYNIENCTFNGDFGGEGAITIQDNANVKFTVNVTGCAFNNIPATSHDIYLIYNNGDLTLNTDF